MNMAGDTDTPSSINNLGDGNESNSRRLDEDQDKD
jgi:hypothetical protein